MEEIAYGELARLTCYSAYHHQKMFGYTAGISLSEYIWRRGMSLTAVDLPGGEEKIADLALKYGYPSLTALNQAFQGTHGIAPSAVKKGGVSVKTYLPISFKITVKRVEEVNCRIENREGIRVVGISRPLHKEIGENFEMAPQMWGKAAMNGTIPRLTGIMDGQPMRLLGVGACGEEENQRYSIAITSSAPIEDGLKECRIPVSAWVAFSGSGTNLSIQELERCIVIEWLPISGYKYGNAPDIEVCLNPNPASVQFEVWIPARKE